MGWSKEYRIKAMLWFLAFLLYSIIANFVLKSRGIYNYSNTAWVLGIFALGYISLIVFLVWRRKMVTVQWNVVASLLVLAIISAFCSVLLVYLYQILSTKISLVSFSLAETPFLTYNYIFPRIAGIIFQQVMVYLLILKTEKHFHAVRHQSQAFAIIFGGLHIFIYLVVPNYFIATLSLFGSFVLGYFLPKIYSFFNPNGLLVGYLIHLSYYLVVIPIVYFAFAWLAL